MIGMMVSSGAAAVISAHAASTCRASAIPRLERDHGCSHHISDCRLGRIALVCDDLEDVPLGHDPDGVCTADDEHATHAFVAHELHCADHRIRLAHADELVRQNVSHRQF